MSFRKKHLKLYFLNFETSIKMDDPNFYYNLYEYESQGWVAEKTEFDKDYCSMITRQNRQEVFDNNSRRLKGKMRYTDQNDIFIGWFYKDDPQIKEHHLIPQKANLSNEQRQTIVNKATEAKLDSKTYNNGMKEIKRKEHPGDGWTLGRLPRSEEHHQNQAEGLRRARVGKIVYNDGARNFYILTTDTPEPHWQRGMKPRGNSKPRNS